MSLRKIKLIQDRNILLERKYISEQPTPPSPGSGTTTPQPITTTTTTVKKITDKELNVLPDCSTVDRVITKQSGYTTNEKIVFVTTNGISFCTTPNKKK